MVDLGVEEGMTEELKRGDVDTAADPAQPKEGPMGSQVEHHWGADRDHLPTGIMSCRSKQTDVEGTNRWVSSSVVVVVT
jgi:hypothetical protein